MDIKRCRLRPKRPLLLLRALRDGLRVFPWFARHDGRVGTRNYIAVVAASNCAAYTSELIAQSFADQALPSNVDGIVAFPHGEGCGMSIGPDSEQLQRTLKGVLDHPNVSAALILGLGCEVNQISHYLGEAGDNAPATLQGLTMQETGGTHGAVQFARGHIQRFIERAAEEKRSETPASNIVLGLNCGGSDSFSGITANPALGHCSDLIVAQGGTVVLAETTEIFGAEHLLTRRARSPEIAEKLLRTIESYKRYLRQFGGSFNDNPSPGTKKAASPTSLRSLWARSPRREHQRSKTFWRFQNASSPRVSCLWIHRVTIPSRSQDSPRAA